MFSADIFLQTKQDGTTIATEPASDPAPAAEEPTTEPATDPAPAAEEPATDPAPAATEEPATSPAPATDEPATDPAPAAEEPATDPAPATEEPATEPAAEPAPAEEPATEEPSEDTTDAVEETQEDLADSAEDIQEADPEDVADETEDAQEELAENLEEIVEEAEDDGIEVTVTIVEGEGSEPAEPVLPENPFGLSDDDFDDFKEDVEEFFEDLDEWISEVPLLPEYLEDYDEQITAYFTEGAGSAYITAGGETEEPDNAYTQILVDIGEFEASYEALEEQDLDDYDVTVDWDEESYDMDDEDNIPTTEEFSDSDFDEIYTDDLAYEGEEGEQFGETSSDHEDHDVEVMMLGTPEEVDGGYDQDEAETSDNPFAAFVGGAQDTVESFEFPSFLKTKQSEVTVETDATESTAEVTASGQSTSEGVVLSSTAQVDRDEDPPTDIDDSGDDPKDGDTMFVLVTSFDGVDATDGKVWVIPREDEDEGYILISGLAQPVATCFDVNNEFLYVVDHTFDASNGVIYQYEIDWDDDDDFEIGSNVYTMVYQGPKASDCSVDEYGNLYFTTSDSRINIVSYLDLWSGQQNKHITIYDYESGKIDHPTGLQVVDSEDIWFVNGANVDTVGVLCRADAKVDEKNGETVHKMVAGEVAPGYSVAISDDYAFFTAGNVVYAYHIDDKTLTAKNKELNLPTGVTFGDDDLFIVDRGQDAIFKVDAEDDSEELLDPWIKIENAYGVFAVNAAWLMAVSLLSLLY